MCENKTSLEFEKVVESTIIYAIWNNGEIVGSLEVVISLDTVYIEQIFIYEEFRDRKIGHSLMRLILEFFKNLTYKNFWLFVEFGNERAQHLYRKFGFQFDNYIGDYCYRMSLILGE